MAALAQHQRFAFQLRHLVVHVLRDLLGVRIIAGEIAVVGHIVHLVGERPVGAGHVEDLGGGGDGEREEFRLARDQRLLRFQLVLQFLLHPIDRIDKVLLRDGHVVFGVEGGIDGGLQRVGHAAHGG